MQKPPNPKAGSARSEETATAARKPGAKAHQYGREKPQRKTQNSASSKPQTLNPKALNPKQRTQARIHDLKLRNSCFEALNSNTYKSDPGSAAQQTAHRHLSTEMRLKPLEIKV